MRGRKKEHTLKEKRLIPINDKKKIERVIKDLNGKDN